MAGKYLVLPIGHMPYSKPDLKHMSAPLPLYSGYRYWITKKPVQTRQILNDNLEPHFWLPARTGHSTTDTAVPLMFPLHISVFGYLLASPYSSVQPALAGPPIQLPILCSLPGIQPALHVLPGNCKQRIRISQGFSLSSCNKTHGSCLKINPGRISSIWQD